MSYNRRQQDAKKMNNFVAKHDFNRGGFHGKSKKAVRRNEHVNLSQICTEDMYNEDLMEEIEDELGRD